MIETPILTKNVKTFSVEWWCDGEIVQGFEIENLPVSGEHVRLGEEEHYIVSTREWCFDSVRGHLLHRVHLIRWQG